MSYLGLGVDVGTAGDKGVLVDTDDGTVVVTASRSHELASPIPGWVERDAEATWWQGSVALARELTGAGHGPVVGAGVSGIGPCLLLARIQEPNG